MSLIACFKSYPCKHCSVKFKILPTETGSYLPAEWKHGKEPEGEKFDARIHTSHLLNCTPRQHDWKHIQKELIKNYEKLFDEKNKLR